MRPRCLESSQRARARDSILYERRRVHRLCEPERCYRRGKLRSHQTRLQRRVPEASGRDTRPRPRHVRKKSVLCPYAWTRGGVRRVCRRGNSPEPAQCLLDARQQSDGREILPLHWRTGESYPFTWCAERITNGDEDSIWIKSSMINDPRWKQRSSAVAATHEEASHGKVN